MSNTKQSCNSRNYEHFNLCAFFSTCVMLYIKYKQNVITNQIIIQIKSNYNPDLFTDLFLITCTQFSGELWTFPVINFQFPVFAHSTLPSPPHNIHSKLHVLCTLFYILKYIFNATITMAYGSKCQSVCKSNSESVIYSRM